ncbi:MAG: SMC-Scp complex subunit ScpB [Cyanobacteria bacterium SZAS-4]|nr:SMC-Scp complex subunit ScpB [Cyanobacteria bacterium SZAS-4]
MLKSKVEAILFLTDKPMRAQAIARIVNEDVQVVRQAILDLIHDYEERASGLEIADDNGYIIQVKDEYASIIDEFVPMEMPVALIRTLSAIAIKQPVMQSEIIKIRGAGAYDHIKELMTRELIIKKEEGRSPTLSTTKKFQEYFRLSHDAKSLRTQLRKEDKVATKEAAGTGGDGDSDVPNIHPESIEAEQAKNLEVLYDSSPDSSLVFRPTDLDGTSAPLGADVDNAEIDNDITVMVDDIGAGDNTADSENDDAPSINVSVSPDITSTSAAAVSSKFDGTSSGSAETTDKNPESDNNDE